MSARWTELLAARARVEAADRRIADGIGALKYRLAPATLAADGRKAVKARAREAATSARKVASEAGRIVTENPARSGIAVAALVAFFARHRIADAVARVTRSKSSTERTVRGRSRT